MMVKMKKYIVEFRQKKYENNYIKYYLLKWN